MAVKDHRPADLMEPRIVGPGFHTRVYQVVRQVPAGRVTTYGDVATLLGSPRVARHVGWALSALRHAPEHSALAGAEDSVGPDDDVPNSANVPWHRVINARGRVSHRGDTLRASEQYIRLSAEGVVVDDHGRIELKNYRWDGAGCVVPAP